MIPHRTCVRPRTTLVLVAAAVTATPLLAAAANDSVDPTDPPASAPAAVDDVSDEFFDSLSAPVELENLDAIADLDDGVRLELSYMLPDVGRVSIVVYGEGDGSGFGLVTVNETVVCDMAFLEGRITSDATDLTSLLPGHAHAIAASIIQVWREVELTAALTASRDVKCWVAGGIAGATAATLVGGTCLALVKHPSCVDAGRLTASSVTGWIAAKCNAAQNK